MPGRARWMRAAPAPGGCLRRGLRRSPPGAEQDDEVSVPRPRRQVDPVFVDAPRRVPPIWTTAARGRAGPRQPAGRRCTYRPMPLTATRGGPAPKRVVEFEQARERLSVGMRRALRVAVEGRVSAGCRLAGPGDAQRPLCGRERSQRVAKREVLGDGAASGHAREERHRHHHARAHEQRTAGAGAEAPAREREHGGRASPPRAAVRGGSAVLVGGGLAHVVGAPKDTAVAGVPPLG
jgi:hypothetical protein